MDHEKGDDMMLCYVKNGTKGVITKAVQVKLNQLGFYKGSIDSWCGPVLTAAIRNYQKSKKLVVDGCVGPITWKSLFGVPYPNTMKKSSTSAKPKGPIQTALEKGLGSFRNITEYCNKIRGQGYGNYYNDVYNQNEAVRRIVDKQPVNCSDGSQVTHALALEMGYESRYVHVKCLKSGTGHVYLQVKGKELGSSWVNIDTAAIISKESKYPIGKAWCQDGKIVGINASWLLSDDGKT